MWSIKKVCQISVISGALFIGGLNAQAATVIEMSPCADRAQTSTFKFKKTSQTVSPQSLVDLSFETKEDLIHPYVEVSIVDDAGSIKSSDSFSLQQISSGTNYLTAPIPASMKDYSGKAFLVARINDRLCFYAQITATAQPTPETQIIAASFAGPLSCSLQKSTVTPAWMLLNFVLFTALVGLLALLRRSASRIRLS